MVPARYAQALGGLSTGLCTACQVAPPVDPGALLALTDSAAGLRHHLHGDIDDDIAMRRH